MIKTVTNILFCLMLLTTTSCKGLKTDVGIRGILCGDDLMTLDGDIFRIQERICDSFLIVCPHSEEESCYLIKQEKNGFYYVQQKGIAISSIENTQSYVCVDNKMVYNLKSKTLFSLPCDASYLYYLGQWNDKVAFTNQDSICFSDGKCVALQKDAICKAFNTEDIVTLCMGARTLNVSIAELYQHKTNSASSNRNVTKLTKSYFMQPRSKYENMEAGFDVDLDIPKGTTGCDNAIREWLLSSIRDDAFSLLDNPSIKSYSYTLSDCRHVGTPKSYSNKYLIN